MPAERNLFGFLAITLFASALSCATNSERFSPSPIDVFPGVRAVPDGRIVELDALSTPFFDTFEEGEIFLELIACSPDSKEHETLLICRAKASQIHAAMLLAGFTPGSPVVWSSENGRMNATPPTGDRLDIHFVYDDSQGKSVEVSPHEWIVSSHTGERPPDEGFVFAGSRIVQREGETRYDADFTGTLIGLASFGGELIAYPEPISPESSIDEPVWMADQSSVPAGDVPVVIRITARR